jgi:hypothetical protein
MLGPDDFITFYGVRREGKSWCARYFAWALRAYFPYAEVMSGTSFSGWWQQHFPTWKVIHGWNPGVVMAILQEQAKVIEQYDRDPSSVNPYRLLILDDVVTDAGQSAELKALATRARHFKLCVMMMTQHPQLLHTSCRGNTDIVVIFRLHEAAALECIAKCYLPQIPVSDAITMMQRYCWKSTDRRHPTSQCLIINNRDGNTLQERLFALQAPDPGPFIIGCKAYWQKQARISVAPGSEDEEYKVEGIDANTVEDGSQYLDEKHKDQQPFVFTRAPPGSK